MPLMGSPRRAGGLSSANSPRGPSQRKPAAADSKVGDPSEGAGVRRGVWRVIRAVGADWVINPAVETAASNAKALVADVRHGTCTKASNVASAKAAHMAAATSTAASGLCTRGKKAPGKHRARQNHHRSSSHDLLHLVGRTCRHRTILKRRYFTKVISNVTMKERWDCRSVASTKFSFNQQKLCGRTNGCRLAWRTISML